LNYFYNRWQLDAPAPLPVQAEEDSGAEQGDTESEQSEDAPPELCGLIDNFDGGLPVGTNGWETYWDEGTKSSLTCGAESGAGFDGSGLRFDYQISPYSWGTCGLYYDQVQDWSTTRGLVFSIHAGQTDQVLHVDLFADGPEGEESYIYELDFTPAIEDDWVQVGIPWDEFHRVDWEADAGSPFSKPDQVTGLAFGFGSEEDELDGVLWIDELGWMQDGESTVEESADQKMSQAEEPEEEESGGFNLPCLGSLAMPLGLVGIVLLQRKRLRER
ncbi:MAG: hypothetical protein MUO54_14280, partial [Anaerolineales bacterium]|nr:hypothetical protein [Anaerolineales bacterium]